MQHTDKVIMSEYSGMSSKGEGRSDVYTQIVGDEVQVVANENAGSVVIFDKQPSQVSYFHASMIVILTGTIVC